MSTLQYELDQNDDSVKEKIEQTTIALFESEKIGAAEKNQYLQKTLLTQSYSPRFLTNIIMVFFSHGIKANEKTLLTIKNCVEKWDAVYQNMFRGILEKSKYSQKNELLFLLFPPPITDKEYSAPKLGDSLVHLDEDILADNSLIHSHGNIQDSKSLNLTELSELPKQLMKKIYAISPLTEILFLLEAVANVNLILPGVIKEVWFDGYNAEGFGALHLACHRQRPDRLQLLQGLLHHGANVNMPVQGSKTDYKAIKSMTALHLIMYEKPSFDEVDLLLQSGAKISLTPLGNVSPLHVAAEQAVAAEVIERLAQQPDANWKVKDEFMGGNTPLHFAIRNHEKHTVKTFAAITQYSDINAVDVGQQTPMHLACLFYIPIEFINILLRQKPNLSLKNNESLSVLDTAHSQLIYLQKKEYDISEEEYVRREYSLRQAIKAIQEPTPTWTKTLTRKITDKKIKSTHSWNSIQGSLGTADKVVTSSSISERIAPKDSKHVAISPVDKKQFISALILHRAQQSLFQDQLLCSIYQDYRRRLHEANQFDPKDKEEAVENLHASIKEYIKISDRYDETEIIKLICKTELSGEPPTDHENRAQKILQEIISEDKDHFAQYDQMAFLCGQR